jgi:hypothetical protein
MVTSDPDQPNIAQGAPNRGRGENRKNWRRVSPSREAPTMAKTENGRKNKQSKRRNMPATRSLLSAAAVLAALVLGGALLAGAAAGATAASAPAAPAVPVPGAAPAAPSPQVSAEKAHPVVVELFTSQGCSSCPPADRLLSQLGGGAREGQLIPLAFHVDYWNHLGWSDPFSSSRWSQRQAAYGRMFRSASIYTPQLVVNGRSECVGSRRDQVARRIAEARAAQPAGNVSVSAEEVATGAARALRVRVGAKRLQAAGAPLELWVAVTQSGLTTSVGAGENAAATLRNDFVVRRLEKAFTLGGGAGSEQSGEVSIALDPAWRASQVAVVAFLQDPASLAIQGAAAQGVALSR